MKSNNKYNGSNEYQKAIDFLEKGCDCDCFSRIPKEEFGEYRLGYSSIVDLCSEYLYGMSLWFGTEWEESI